jgi:hypothetical protein
MTSNHKMQFSDYFEGEPGDYGLSVEAAQLIVDFCGKIEASDFDLEPTKPVFSEPRGRTNLIVVSFRSQRRHWQLWVTGQPALKLTFQWIMSNMREATHSEMLAEHEHAPATFNKAWEIVQKVETRLLAE